MTSADHDEIATRGALLTAHDVYLLKQGSHWRLYDRLGAHRDDAGRVRFAVWAPNATSVSVVGAFNDWQAGVDPMRVRDDGSGVWEAVVDGVADGAPYKYRVESGAHGHVADKGDPFAFYWETPPATASRVWSIDYEWRDGAWLRERAARNALDAPWSIYEVHLGSWRRVPEEGNRPLTYRELAEQLPAYVADMGFTHVELLPVTEHPFYGSWGYQTVGYFAPSARYGTPQDFMHLVERLHAAGIGVILDWVPAHFPDDAHGPVFFDGTHLYEHADPRQGVHAEWGSKIFNFGRNEVRAFLLSSAVFWIEKYHIDGLRVDAVASMLYLDYGRREGEWIPNRYGGRENLEAVSFLRAVNEAVYQDHPDTHTIAEESTAWPMVSRPTYLGGLGFGLKWNMGWMHDTLKYFSLDPVFRKFQHDRITFSIWYAFHENFVLPLSHDEVVHGKGSLIGKMPGDEWQQFANLRLLFGYMWAHPGKKLLFMGCEFGQRREWQHEESLEWFVLQFPPHQGMQNWIRDLNRFYRDTPALHALDFSADGFEWVDCHDSEQSVLSFLRHGKHGDTVLVVCNNTPVLRENHRLGVPAGGRWVECLNSDAPYYGGSGQGNLGGLEASPLGAHGRPFSLTLRLPPLGVLFLRQATD